MAKLAALISLILVCTTLDKKCCTNTRKRICNTVNIYGKDKKIELLADDFFLTEKKAGFNLSINNDIKFQSIKDLEYPKIEFCYKGKKIVALGNPEYSSSIPVGAKCFYPLSIDNKIYFFDDNNISLLMVDSLIKKGNY